MQGYHDKQLPLFQYIDLDQLIPSDHLVRRLDRVVDLSFIREMTEDLYRKDFGRPSLDPELFFRMQILLYSFNIPSERQLCREIQVNLAYRWYLRLPLDQKVPDHSSLTKIRKRLGSETFQKIFNRIVVACQKANLVTGQRIMTDSTLIEANASMNSLAENPGCEPPEYRENQNYRNRIAGFADGQKKFRYSNQTHTSKTDPDARLVMRPGLKRSLYYKTHFSIDSKFRLITDCYTSHANVQDFEVLPDRIENQLKTFNFPISESIADKGYGSVKVLSFLADRGIKPFIPLRDVNSTWAWKKYFTFNEKLDHYECPAGEFLEFKAFSEQKSNIALYSSEEESCSKCILKTPCINNKKRKIIFHHPDEKLIVKLRKRAETKAFKTVLSERHWKMEGVIGEAKQLCGLRRARYRGIKNMQIQSLMTGLAINFKRVAREVVPGGIFCSRIIQYKKPFVDSKC